MLYGPGADACHEVSARSREVQRYMWTRRGYVTCYMDQERVRAMLYGPGADTYHAVKMPVIGDMPVQLLHEILVSLLSTFGVYVVGSTRHGDH